MAEGPDRPENLSIADFKALANQLNILAGIETVKP